MARLKLLFLGAALAIFVFALFGFIKTTPPKQEGSEIPKIQIQPEFFDFGQIKYGQVVEQTFEVKNLGSEVLEIKRVATSCGCTTAKVSSSQINPGQQTQLLVVYDTGQMSGAHGKGQQERIIYVKSNDPENPQAEVIIKANVE